MKEHIIQLKRKVSLSFCSTVNFLLLLLQPSVPKEESSGHNELCWNQNCILFIICSCFHSQWKMQQVFNDIIKFIHNNIHVLSLSIVDMAFVCHALIFSSMDTHLPRGMHNFYWAMDHFDCHVHDKTGTARSKNGKSWNQFSITYI